MKKTLLFSIALLTLGCTPKSPEPLPSASPSSTTTVSSNQPELTGALQADVQLDRETYRPGDQITVMTVATNLTDSAWVGVVPSAIPHGQEEENDNNDLGYVFVKDNTRIILVAPREPGDYDVRLNDDDNKGKEIASRSFQVTDDTQPVTQAKLTWQPEGSLTAGESVEVGFEAPLSFAENAWIGIVPTDTPHGKESENDPVNLGYEHLDGRSRGSVELQLPTTPGTYDMRMFDSDSNGNEVGSVTFEVSEK